MNDEKILIIRDILMDAILNCKDDRISDIDKYDTAMFLNSYYDPENHKDNEKVLRKNYYENQRWKKYKEN